jgi:hypothetical protein
MYQPENWAFMLKVESPYLRIMAEVVERSELIQPLKLPLANCTVLPPIVGVPELSVEKVDA